MANTRTLVAQTECRVPRETQVLFWINEPGNLGSRVGMIYGSMSVLALVVPEMKGRSLEELDELFHSITPAWKSTRLVATGVGAEITHIEGVKIDVLDGKAGKD
ncbi:hypothetical protein B0T10DRAFT_468156 [Thelonectria olida]|uniref:Uncharacterized protein n=1 Tax=Thelonectria olida TaxID=1576542 RepID=A0A9P8VQ54_9HYPO|nr:hypothetical protein B0T10DRAFT_468156 [Thelonectria olida]